MKKHRYEEMLPHEIVKRRKRFPAAFIGLGGLEWHGEHLAVGNDALKAEKLCEMAAARCGGFAMPTLWYGEPRLARLMEATHDEDGRICASMKLKKSHLSPAYKGYGKSPEAQIDFFKQLVFHTLVQMNSLGMRAVCLLCGHYPLGPWAHEAVTEFNKGFKDTQVFAGAEYVYPIKRKSVGGDHAAKWETSFLWYLRPDCVDMSVFRNRAREKLIGVMGEDPRKEASVELGRSSCELIVEGMVAKAGELIARTRDTRK